MIFLSNEFEAALHIEIERLVAERQSDFFETPAFFAQLDSEVQKSLSSMSPFFSYEKEGEKLRLFLGPPESDAERHIDLDDIVADELLEGSDEHLKFILSGLERLANVIRERLSSNAAGEPTPACGRSDRPECSAAG